MMAKTNAAANRRLQACGFAVLVMGKMPFLFFVSDIYIAKQRTLVNEQFVFCSLLIADMRK
jgi:hypothetical protein